MLEKKAQFNESDYLSSRLFRSTGLIFNFGKWLLFLVVVTVTVNALLLTIGFVSGDSMFPTLTNRSVLIVDHRDWQVFHQGDIVVLHYPGDPDQLQFVKRIIGLPGEIILISSEHVLIDGQLLSEPYLPAGTLTSPAMLPQRIPANEYFTMGDNREHSNDSRFFGSVPRRFIIGRVLGVPIRAGAR